MKRIISLLLLLAFCFGVLIACNDEAPPAGNDEKTLGDNGNLGDDNTNSDKGDDEIGGNNSNSGNTVITPAITIDTYLRVNAEGNPDARGEYILFGEYPQTLKADDVTITSNTDSRGYYLGSDGFYYAKMTANQRNSNYTFSSGESISNGEVYYFKVESVRWRILSEESNTLFILCDSIIENKEYDGYDGGNYSNNFAESNIRAWLNEEFYSEAFNALQKALIDTVVVDNSALTTGDPSSFEWSNNSYACDNTEDKVFLLSYSEATDATYGFSSTQYDSAYQKQVSDYARAIGAYMDTDIERYGNGWWWLRSPHYSDANNVRVVRYAISVGGGSYASGKYGVVPALRIRFQ